MACIGGIGLHANHEKTVHIMEMYTETDRWAYNRVTTSVSPSGQKRRGNKEGFKRWNSVGRWRTHFELAVAARWGSFRHCPGQTREAASGLIREAVSGPAAGRGRGISSASCCPCQPARAS